MYDNVDYLNNKLKDNNLTQSNKKNIPKKEQKLNELKNDFGKRTGTDQARSFKDQNKELSGSYADERFNINLEEFLLKYDYNDINRLNNRLKDNSLTPAENKKILNNIDKIKKSIPKREKKIYELKKDLEKKKFELIKLNYLLTKNYVQSTYKK